jgi:hypothetical protein
MITEVSVPHTTQILRGAQIFHDHAVHAGRTGHAGIMQSVRGMWGVQGTEGGKRRHGDAGAHTPALRALTPDISRFALKARPGCADLYRVLHMITPGLSGNVVTESGTSREQEPARSGGGAGTRGAGTRDGGRRDAGRAAHPPSLMLLTFAFASADAVTRAFEDAEGAFGADLPEGAGG